jgi:hypothetical protein
MPNPKDEANLIAESLFDEFGTGGISAHGDIPFIDGRDAVLEMKESGYPNWKQVEWAGHHIKYLVQKNCSEGLCGAIVPYNLRSKHFVKGEYVWDARFKGHESNRVPLSAVTDYDSITRRNGGIGVFIVDALWAHDLNGDFRRWHEEQKGAPSRYSIIREREGRPEHPRKSAYAFGKIIAYFFAYNNLQNGVRDGWLQNNWQIDMRNAGGESRTAKYLLKVDKVPRDYLIYAKNFNEEPDDFAEDYPEFV